MKTQINAEELQHQIELRIRDFKFIGQKATNDYDRHYWGGYVAGLEKAIELLVGEDKKDEKQDS